MLLIFCGIHSEMLFNLLRGYFSSSDSSRLHYVVCLPN